MTGERDDENILLRTRLEVLRSSVDQVGRLLKMVSATHVKTEALTTALANLREMHMLVPQHDDLRKAVTDLRSGLSLTPGKEFQFDRLAGQIDTLINQQLIVSRSVGAFFDAWDKLVPMRVGDPEVMLEQQLEAVLDTS